MHDVGRGSDMGQEVGRGSIVGQVTGTDMVQDEGWFRVFGLEVEDGA